MGDGYNFQQLKAAILALSRATDWEVAKKEWRLFEISEADESETCLCGHFPIIELCTIAMPQPGSRSDVGNVCVKRFLGFRSDLIFHSLKRVRAKSQLAACLTAVPSTRQALRKAVGTTWLHWCAVAY
jgi:hypothetical protein